MAKDAEYYKTTYPLLSAYKASRPILPGMAGGNQVFMDEDLLDGDGKLQTVTDGSGVYTHQQVNQLREAAMLKALDTVSIQSGASWGGTATKE